MARIAFSRQAVPVPADGWLLIRVRDNALCGSVRSQFLDVSVVTPGHEAAAVVACVGPETCTAAGAR